MRAAINVEAAFALLALLCFIFGYPSRQNIKSDDSRLDRRAWLLLLPIVPAALLWTLRIPFVSDDFVHILAALRFAPDRLGGLFTIPETNHFFRPLGYVSLDIDGLWAGRSAALWHLGALLIHFANCLLLYVLARQKGLARGYAAVAAAIFGVHGSRPEAVTWIAGRFDLLATLFVLATLTLFLRGRYKAALVTALLALISKESAYVLPALLLLITDRPQWKRAAPYAALTAAVFMYRWHVLSGIGGYVTGSQTPDILNFSLLRTANALLLRLWAVLFFPVNWSAAPQWWLWIALGLGSAAYAFTALRGQRQPRTFAFLAFTLTAALPVQHLLLIGADLEKSRVLCLPSVGFALFLACALEAGSECRPRLAAAIAILAFQAACLEHNLIVWRGVAEEARTTCDSVAAELSGYSGTVKVLDVPIVLRGVYFLHNGLPECLNLTHGIDYRRALAEDAGMVLRWDKQSETVKQ